MASTEYAPGTVAVATVRGVEGVRVISCGKNGYHDFWWSPDYVIEWRQHEDRYVTDVRPLVVLDLADAQHCLTALRKAMETESSITARLLIAAVARRIEAQTKPPRIPEPTECGATVIAAQTGEIEGSDRLWVRFRHGSKNCWIDQYEHVRSWGDLDNPRTTECEGES